MRGSVVISHNRAVQASDQQALETMHGMAAELDSHIDDELLDPSLPTPSIALVEHAFGAVQADVATNGFLTDGMQSLIRFYNEHLLPLSRVDIGDPPVVQGVAVDSHAAACGDAELCFVDALNQVGAGRSVQQSRISVYHGPGRKPFAFRKSWRESTALTLEPIDVQGLIVPAGTIIGFGEGQENARESGFRRWLNYDMETYLVEGAFELCPLRLSPWAFSAAVDQAGFAVELFPEPEYDLARGRKIERTTIEDFRAAAKKVMVACGVSGGEG